MQTILPSHSLIVIVFASVFGSLTTGPVFCHGQEQPAGLRSLRLQTQPPERNRTTNREQSRGAVIQVAMATNLAEESVELAQARQEFKKRVDTATEEILKLFDKQKEIAVKRGDPAAGNVLDRQRERLIRQRILPTAISTGRFEKEILSAVTLLQKAYQTEINKNARSGDKSSGSSLKAECEKLIAPYVFDGRRVYRREGNAVYAIQADNSWLETKPKGDYVQFSEANRTDEYIELKSKTTDVRVRLYSDRVSLKHGYYPWGHFKKGGWLQ